jgi:hypothetical protein
VTRNGDYYGLKEGMPSFNLSDTNNIAVDMLMGTDMAVLTCYRGLINRFWTLTYERYHDRDVVYIFQH